VGGQKYGVLIFMLWGGETLKQNVMEQTKTTLSQGQREVIARLLAEARKRQEGLLESEWELDRRVKAEFLPKLAEERGGGDLFGKVLTLKSQLRDAERDLENLGFCCDDEGRIDLINYHAPKDLEKALEDKQREAKAERQRSLTKFDLAVLNVWTANSADEAKRIVGELL
jgi:hypothetical protein